MSTDTGRFGGGTWPSKNNRQGVSKGGEPPESDIAPREMPGDVGLRPVSVEPGRKLRDEATHDTGDGMQARPWYAVVSEWRDWYTDYESMHIEFESPEGETERTQLENSYMPEYGARYYSKLKDLERGIERRYENLTTVMLTFSASSENAEGRPRCPADHMRDIAAGWDTARKQLHQTLSGDTWQYARVWEPHKSGYGHMHVAVFVEDREVSAGEFRPVLESYLSACGPAGRAAHTVENAVSVNDDVENLGTYISEYIGIFGESAVERSMHEQAFYAVTWATGTRRVEFSNGAQDIINGEQFRRETGLRPADRGETDTTQSDSEPAESGAEPDGAPGWSVDAVCTVRGEEPNYADPTSGGVEMTAIDGRPGMDPPPDVE